MQTHSIPLESLAAAAREKKQALEQLKAQHAHGLCGYDELAAGARAFCEAFYAYQVARWGKRKAKRLDPRAVIR